MPPAPEDGSDHAHRGRVVICVHCGAYFTGKQLPCVCTRCGRLLTKPLTPDGGIAAEEDGPTLKEKGQEWLDVKSMQAVLQRRHGIATALAKLRAGSRVRQSSADELALIKAVEKALETLDAVMAEKQAAFALEEHVARDDVDSN